MLIETDRLHIHAITETDALLLMKDKRSFFHRNGLEESPYWPGDGLLALLPLYTEAIETGRQKVSIGPWYIVKKTNVSVIGDIGFKKEAVHDGRLEVGYSIIPPEQGKGFAQEALRAITDWAFAANIPVIHAQCDRTNHPSLNVLKKACYKLYGQEGDILYFRAVKQ